MERKRLLVLFVGLTSVVYFVWVTHLGLFALPQMNEVSYSWYGVELIVVDSTNPYPNQKTLNSGDVIIMINGVEPVRGKPWVQSYETDYDLTILRNGLFVELSGVELFKSEFDSIRDGRLPIYGVALIFFLSGILMLIISIENKVIFVGISFILIGVGVPSRLLSDFGTQYLIITFIGSIYSFLVGFGFLYFSLQDNVNEDILTIAFRTGMVFFGAGVLLSLYEAFILFPNQRSFDFFGFEMVSIGLRVALVSILVHAVMITYFSFRTMSMDQSRKYRRIGVFSFVGILPILFFLLLPNWFKSLSILISSILMLIWIPFAYISLETTTKQLKKISRWLLLSMILIAAAYSYSSINLLLFYETEGITSEISFILTILVLIFALMQVDKITFIEDLIIGKAIVDEKYLAGIHRDIINSPSIETVIENFEKTFSKFSDIHSYDLFVNGINVISSKLDDKKGFHINYFPIFFEGGKIGQVRTYGELSEFTYYQIELVLSAISVGIHLSRYVKYTQKLGDRLVIASEKERDNLRTALHNGPLQYINHLILIMNSDEKNEEILEKYVSQLKSVSREIRSFLRKLTNSISGNIQEIVMDEVSRFKDLFLSVDKSIYVQTSIDSAQMSSEEKMAFYQVLKESLNNIYKHSQASNVLVSFKNLGDQLILSIKDDGIGYQSSKAQQEGMGIASLKYWAKSIGAELYICSDSGVEIKMIAAPGAGFPDFLLRRVDTK